MSMRLMTQAMSIKVGNPLRKLVLIKLAYNASDDGICFPSYQYIADVCEISRRSAVNHIESSIDMGFVIKKSGKNKDGSSSNLYFLNLEKGSARDSPSSAGNSSITYHSLEPINEPIKKLSKKVRSFCWRKQWKSRLLETGKDLTLTVMADKFGVVKNATDGTVQNVFTVTNNQLVLSGDLIADGSIIGRHIRANAEINGQLLMAVQLAATQLLALL